MIQSADMQRWRHWRHALLVVVMAGSGCSLAPNYHPTDIAVPAYFNETPPGWSNALPDDGTSRGAWWQRFNDPVLNDLEQSADTASPTLAAALARYDEARAIVGESAAAQLPEIDANGSVVREHLSQNKPLIPHGINPDYKDFNLAGSLAYELDFWGRIRNEVRASQAGASARASDLSYARLSLQADVADAYARLRGFDAEEDLLKRAVTAYRRACDLTEARHAGGIDSGIDVGRARTVLGNAQAQVSAIASQRAATEHQLAALTGALASNFHITPVPHPLGVIPIPVGTPSELLQRRPDIAAAERRMAAANAQIGVARAAMFPSVTLGASAGYETSGPNLLSVPSSFWGIGPASVSLPLFDNGLRRAGVRQARATYREQAENYRSVVLTAFRQVEDALAASHHLSTQTIDQQSAAQAAEATSRLALLRYQDGASNYLEVVLAQTDALNDERALLEVQTQRAQASVALVRALGGPFG